ncbi:MAG: hypothetical protein RL021_1755 [Bacteroidota bacterium]|jgi:hypothetical protein
MISSSKKDLWNVLLLALFPATAVFLWDWLRWYVNNPDSFQYIQLAHHYSEGRWSEAVNGYWSPLIPWLLTPFIKSGIASVELFKILQLSIALVALFIWIKLIDLVRPGRAVGYIVKAAAIPLLLSHAFLYLTPDLLFTTLILLLLRLFIRYPVWNDTRMALIAGSIGAALYFAKAFGLPFFLVFISCSLVFHRLNGNQVRPLPFVVMLGVFVMLCGSWVTLISVKYGHFTVSEAARFNTTQSVSPMPGQIVRLPYLYTEGLVKPAGAHALSAWEEPMEATVSDESNRWESIRGSERIVELVSRNLQAIWYLDFRRQAGCVFLLLLTFYLYFSRKELFRSPLLFYPMLVLLTVYAGYSLILFHARYSWICGWSMMFLSNVMVVSLTDRIPRALRRGLYAGLFLFLLLSVKRPLKELLFTADKEMTASEIFKSIKSVESVFRTTYEDDRLVTMASKQLSSIDGPLASRYSDHQERNRYFSSLTVAESCQQPYFGQIDDRSAGSLEALHRSGIRYFMIWDDTTERWCGDLPAYSFENLKVYRLR